MKKEESDVRRVVRRIIHYTHDEVILNDSLWMKSANSYHTVTMILFESGVEIRPTLVNAALSLELGPVDKPSPNADASEQDESAEGDGELVISGGNTPLLLEMPDEALNARPQRIDRLADRVLYLAVALGRDLGCRAAVAQVMADCIAVVALVGQHGTGVAIALLHQAVVRRHVVGLAFTEYDADRETHGVAAQVDLGAEPTA